VWIIGMSLIQASPRFYRVWFLAIGLGFAVLALRSAIRGWPARRVVLECVIAIGFLLLARFWFRSSPRS
jgi:hypothetical protein